MSVLQNYASYQPGTFTIDVSQFTNGEQLFVPEDMPAFLHEYCHFIQDIGTISSILGFYLWMLDLVNLTRIFSDGEGKIITLPLPDDPEGQPINKYRKFYNIICGNPDDVFDIDYNRVKFKENIAKDEHIDVGTWQPHVRLNRIIMEGRVEPLEFRLIALQEVHAFYAQQLAEKHYRAQNASIAFNIRTEDLKAYPYQFGDHLFDVFNVAMPLEAKFILVGLCLDTIQAPSIFLMVLEAIKGRIYTLSEESVNELIAEVEKARQSCAYSNEEALAQIMPDLEKWAQDDRRLDLKIGLEWYTTMIKMSQDFKKDIPIGFNIFACRGIGALTELYHVFPVPLFYQDNMLKGNVVISQQPGQDIYYQMSSEAASAFWMLRKIYNFLCSPDTKSLHRNAKCPLYDNCLVRPALQEDYTCAHSPWEIVKDKKTVPCLYGRAACSIGLYQNSVDFEF